jgi:hypothetical protein
MAITKGTGTSVLASTTTTATSSAQDVSANYLTEVYISIVVVGTPTAAATVQIQVSPDAGTKYYSPQILLVTTPLAAGTYEWVIMVPTSAGKYKTTFTAQTGGTSSTCVVQSNNVTAV